MENAVKTLGALAVLEQSWDNSDDGTAVTVGEATAVQKRFDKLLGEDIRWVFVGEDLNDGDHEELKQRQQTIVDLRNGAGTVIGSRYNICHNILYGIICSAHAS